MQTLSSTKSAQYSWYSYLVFVLTKTQNEPKQPETSQNEPKQAETTRNQQRRSPKVLISNVTFFLERFEPKSPNLSALGQKVLTF